MKYRFQNETTKAEEYRVRNVTHTHTYIYIYIYIDIDIRDVSVSKRVCVYFLYVEKKEREGND